MALEVHVDVIGKYGKLTMAKTSEGKIRLTPIYSSKIEPSLPPVQVECGQNELRDALEVVLKQGAWS